MRDSIRILAVPQPISGVPPVRHAIRRLAPTDHRGDYRPEAYRRKRRVRTSSDSGAPWLSGGPLDVMAGHVPAIYLCMLEPYLRLARGLVPSPIFLASDDRCRA
jgi:hypothetical protein